MDLFNSRKVNELQNEIDDLEDAIEQYKKDKNSYDRKMEYVVHTHKLELLEKEFELEHFKDEEVSRLKKALHMNETRIAVLENENEMLDQVVDLNGDIVDIKKLIDTLVDKIPTMDFKNLTINSTNKK